MTLREMQPTGPVAKSPNPQHRMIPPFAAALAICYSGFHNARTGCHQSMVNLVLEEARKGNARKVKKINLVLGELSGWSGTACSSTSV